MPHQKRDICTNVVAILYTLGDEERVYISNHVFSFDKVYRNDACKLTVRLYNANHQYFYQYGFMKNVICTLLV